MEDIVSPAYPKLTRFERLVWILFGNFKFGRAWIGGYWLKTHLYNHKPRGVWLCVTYDGFESFKNSKDIIGIEVHN